MRSALKDYNKFVINAHMFEKFIVTHLKNIFTEYSIVKLNVAYSVSPTTAIKNPFSILTHLMFLEQICCQKFTHSKSKKQINEFSLKPSQYIGSSADIRGNLRYLFLEKLLQLNQAQGNERKKILLDREKESETLSLGLKGLEPFESIYSTIEKWAIIPDRLRYGCQINIINRYNNTFLNEIFLSHYGLNMA